jgi:hypothetical protein
MRYQAALRPDILNLTAPVSFNASDPRPSYAKTQKRS